MNNENYSFDNIIVDYKFISDHDKFNNSNSKNWFLFLSMWLSGFSTPTLGLSALGRISNPEVPNSSSMESVIHFFIDYKIWRLLWKVLSITFVESGLHSICKSGSHNAKRFWVCSGAHFYWLHSLSIFWCYVCLCFLDVVSLFLVAHVVMLLLHHALEVSVVCFWLCVQ